MRPSTSLRLAGILSLLISRVADAQGIGTTGVDLGIASSDALGTMAGGQAFLGFRMGPLVAGPEVGYYWGGGGALLTTLGGSLRLGATGRHLRPYMLGGLARTSWRKDGFSPAKLFAGSLGFGMEVGHPGGLLGFGLEARAGSRLQRFNAAIASGYFSFTAGIHLSW